MKNDVKPTFINLITIDGNEVDIKTLSKKVRADIACQLNKSAMTAIGYHEIKTA